MRRSARLTGPRPERVRTALDRWVDLLLRLATIAVGAMIVSRLPLPLLDDWLPIKNVVIAVVSVGLTGKALYDTLFYDRFWP